MRLIDSDKDLFDLFKEMGEKKAELVKFVIHQKPLAVELPPKNERVKQTHSPTRLEKPKLNSHPKC